ncbi:hypothetical protein D8Y22_12770 [Salinadaptatus halalkaliphilus]|uniref:Uncharacterized protein n=1 Tax=Salinadaptatus halalkaliphilus TaxID=2419781 RepID=A0A4S3TLN0_9EURY|nr:hypothetical protein [Salinadaptatus halalkaliphilus]THE64510.1 hypothetical protein D8Y22_12770 [Salinadaptatus halalkaliphilus]
MNTTGTLASLTLVAILGVATTVAAAGFYAGEADATGVETALFETLDTVAGPLFVALILLLFVVFVVSIAITSKNSIYGGRGR